MHKTNLAHSNPKWISIYSNLFHGAKIKQIGKTAKEAQPNFLIILKKTYYKLKIPGRHLSTDSANNLFHQFILR